MQHATSSQDKAFGYLSTIESPEHGYFGGYLIVSHLGRPLEFHCTAPIRPSRAQQILYGPTLEPYLLGEQICGALLDTAKLKPCVIVTDSEAALHARVRCAIPMVFVISCDTTQLGESTALPTDAARTPDETASTSQQWRSRSPSGDIVIGGNHLRLPSGFERDETIVVDALTSLVKHVQLAEPFARIHDAIREAQQLGSRGTDANDQAA
jgi:hypothetical protein